MTNVSSSNGIEQYPQLRFCGFTDPWNSINFNSLFTYIPNNTLSRAELNYNAGEYKNVHYGDVLIKFGPVLDAASNELPFITDASSKKLGNVVLMDGDVIIADTAEDEAVGKATEIINVGDQQIVSGLHTIACRPTIKMSPTYLGFYLNAEAYHKQLYALMQGVKVLSISKSNIEDTIVRYPTLLEQKRICDLLNLLESRITKQGKLIEYLKKYKRGVSNRVFNEVHADKDSSIIDFADAFLLLQNNTFSRDCLTIEETDVLNIHYGDILVKYGAVVDPSVDVVPYIRESVDISKYNTNSYLRNGDVVFADTAEDYAVGKVCEIFNAGGSKILSGLHTMPFRPTFACVPMYLGYYLNSAAYRLQILPMIQGAKVSSISKSEIRKTRLYIPSLARQQQIVNVLYALDQQIDHTEQILEALKKVKTGLLQHLFV